MKRILFLFIAITSLRAADAFIPSPVTPTDWLTVGGTTPTGSSTGQVKIGGGHIMLGALSGGINYLLTQENNTGTGSMVIQAGAGSADFGAAIKLHARAHALHPGELWLGGSSGIGDTVIGNGAAIGPPGNISQILRIGRSGVSTFYGVSPGTTVTAGQVKIGGGKVLAAGMIDSNSNMNAAGYGLNTVGTATGDYRALGRTSASAIILRSYSSNEGGNGNLVLASADNNGIYSFLTVLGGSGPFGIFQGNDPGSTVSGQVRIGGGVIRASNSIYAGDAILQSSASTTFRIYDGTSATQIYAQATSTAAVLGTLTGTPFNIVTGGSSRIYADFASGNVGIGTTAPTSKLTVNGSCLLGDPITNGVVRINAANASQAELQFYNQNSAGYALYKPANTTDVRFYHTTSGDVMALTAAGNVIIGTFPNPQPTSSKLAVAGTITAKEIKVTTTGADYVFENDYKLRSLAEVEQFIAEHKHLPEMMSAKAMQADGMPVSEVVTKQLAKIEELTLYAIQAQKDRDIALARADAAQAVAKATQEQVATQEARIQRLENLIRNLSPTVVP